ncbi:FAD binding domain-containing protein [Cytidiella melzeri]|nr:FAD binding domain-containing protein [Cytidiella melzeri]
MSSTTPDATRTDVLIVGAGPAGLMAANALTRAGIQVKILLPLLNEFLSRPTVVSAGQADGIMPRTIEVFQSYGFAEDFLKQSNQINMVAFYNPREEGGIHRTAIVPVINAPTAHQGAIEKMFLDSLGKHGLAVDRLTRPTSLTLSTDAKILANPDAYPVKAILEHLQETDKDKVTETVYAKFVIGADGAHSWVRRALGIEMEGEQTDHVWGAIDITTTPEANFPDWRNICTIKAQNTTMMLIPREADKIRLYIELGLENGLIDTATGRVAAQSMDAKRLLDIAKEALQPYSIPPAEIDWWTCYVVGQRVASRFSINERAFIVGDACHTHSPKGGQGMNVSINDSHNLAWKLAYVLKGWADLPVLKTYEFERRKFAQELIAFDKWYEAGFSTKARSELFTEQEEKVTPPEPFEAFLAFSGLTSGVGIQYEPSIITISKGELQAPAKLLAVGQRLPPKTVLRAVNSTPIEIQDMCPSDARFKIIIFTGDISHASQLDLVRKFADEILREGGWLKKFGSDVYDIMSVIKGDKENVQYMDVPAVLRPHHYKVLLDAVDTTGKQGGKMYDAWGVRPEGAVVIVRPDGYVASVTGLDETAQLEKYFAGFLKI